MTKSRRGGPYRLSRVCAPPRCVGSTRPREQGRAACVVYLYSIIFDPVVRLKTLLIPSCEVRCHETPTAQITVKWMWMKTTHALETRESSPARALAPVRAQEACAAHGELLERKALRAYAQVAARAVLDRDSPKFDGFAREHARAISRNGAAR